MKKLVSILMPLILLWSLTLPAAAEAAIGSTLRLEETEGTVTVKNASGKNLQLKDGIRLYSGSKIKTEQKSYAYVSLDSGRVVKLDASSEGEVRKSGKKLELKVLSGELFFDVSVPLESDESLNIRTSTMVTGVRGTVGYVVVHDRYSSEICLLEGKLLVSGTDEKSGGIKTTEISAGEKATAVVEKTAQGEQVRLTVEPLKEREVPGFVAVEVAEDTKLQQRIEKKSTLDVQEIIQNAQERLEAEQQQAAEAAKEAQRELEEQEKETEKSQPAQVFAPSGGTSGGTSGGGSSYVPPDEIELSGNSTQADLAAAFDGGSSTVTVPAGTTLTISSGTTTIPAGKTLNLDGTAIISEGAVLSNGGTININSSMSLHVVGSLTNTGRIAVGDGEAGKQGLLAVEGGQLTNSGSGQIMVAAESQLTNEGTIINSAVIQNEGIFQNNGQFTMTGGTVTSAGGTALSNGKDGTASISGGLVSGCGSAIDSTGNLTVDGTAVIKVTVSETEVSKVPCVINGAFTWNGGKLAAPQEDYLPKNIVMPEIEEADGWYTADYANEIRNLPDGADVSQLNEALGIKHVTTVNLDSYISITEDVTVSAGKTLDIQNSTLTVTEEKTFTVSGGRVNVQDGSAIYNNSGTVKVSGGKVNLYGSAQIINEGGTVNVTAGTVDAEGTAISNSGGTVNVSGGTVSGGNFAIFTTSSTVNMTGGTVKAVGTAISAADGTVHVTGGTVNADGTAISVSGTEVTVRGSSVSGGTCAIDNYGGSVEIQEDAVITADAEEDVSVINGTFTWTGGKLMARNSSAFPQNIAMPEIEEADGWYTADYANEVRNLPDGADVGQLKAALGIGHVTEVNLSSDILLTENVEIATGKTLNIQNGTLTVMLGRTLMVSGGTVNLDGSAQITNDGGEVYMSDGTVEAAGTAIFNRSGIIGVGGGTVRAGSTAICNRDIVKVNEGEVISDGTAIDSTNGKEIRMYSSKGKVIGGQTAIINGSGSKLTVDEGTVSGGVCAIENSGNLTFGGAAIVEVTAAPGADAHVISGNDFGWGKAILKARDLDYFPEKASLAEITSSNGWFTANYACTERHLTVEQINNLPTVLNNLSWVTSVELDLGNGTVEWSEGLTVPTGKTLTLKNGTLQIDAGSVAVDGTLVYNCNIIISSNGGLNVNSSGEVTGTGDFTNNGTVVNNHYFTSGSAFANNGSLTINNNESESVQFINGDAFTNNGTVINNGIFENGAGKTIVNNTNATFTNNGSSELRNGGTFNNYAASFIPDSTFWNTGVYTDNTRTNLYALETDTTTGRVRQFSAVGTTNGWTGWTTGTTVTLYGNSSSYSIAGDLSGFLKVGAGTTVTLDLNGRTVDLGGNCLTVEGNLTIKDSSATNLEGTNGTGTITSTNSEATVKVVNDGILTLISGTIESKAQNGYAVKSQNAQTDQTTEDGSNEPTSRGFSQQGGVLRAKIQQVWDQLKGELQATYNEIEEIFQLIFGSHNN